jgi:hypothetical protein
MGANVLNTDCNPMLPLVLGLHNYDYLYGNSLEKIITVNRKLVLLIVVLLLAGLVGWKLNWFSKKETARPAETDMALKISKNTPVFNKAFGGLMDDYYALRDALVDWDTVKADQAAYALALKTDSLPIAQIKGDSDIINTAKSFTAMVSGDAKGLVGQGNIEQKRKGFNTLTDDLYNLVRTVRYDVGIIYHDRCPMALSDSIEGYWLSNTPKIINPYLGNKHPTYKAKMLGCGEVADSLDFARIKPATDTAAQSRL